MAPEISIEERREQFEADPIRNWAGYKLRKMLQCSYIIAFLFLLSGEEVLRIEFDHIEVVDRAQAHIILFLKFRKTHQDGGTLLSNPNAFFLASKLTSYT
jgi:hypothetical protein